MAVAHRNRDKHSDSGRGTDRERDSDSEGDWDTSSHNNIVSGTESDRNISDVNSVSDSVS